MPLEQLVIGPRWLPLLIVAAGALSGWLLSRAVHALLISHEWIRYLLDE